MASTQASPACSRSTAPSGATPASACFPPAPWAARCQVGYTVVLPACCPSLLLIASAVQARKQQAGRCEESPRKEHATAAHCLSACRLCPGHGGDHSGLLPA